MGFACISGPNAHPFLLAPYLLLYDFEVCLKSGWSYDHLRRTIQIKQNESQPELRPQDDFPSSVCFLSMAGGTAALDETI